MRRENTRQGSMTDEYIRSVISTRRILSHTLNIISQQERTMRNLIANENETRNTPTNNEPLNLDNYLTFFSPSRTPSVTRNPSTNTTTSTASRRNTTNVNTGSSLSTRPSMQDINHATRETSFSSITNPINNICPISREAFTDDEIVMQIIPCGHIFSRDNLRVWFLSSVHCPMCRYDIRNYRNRRNNMRERRQITNATNATNANTLENNSSQSIDRIATFITNDIMGQLETNNTDNSNNLLFEYTLLVPEAQATRTRTRTRTNSQSHET